MLMAPDRVTIAMAPRSAENSWRNVMFAPLAAGCARVQAPSPSWNATQIGWTPVQYATVTVVGGGGGGGAVGDIPSEQAPTAAPRSSTQALIAIERLAFQVAYGRAL